MIVNSSCLSCSCIFTHRSDKVRKFCSYPCTWKSISKKVRCECTYCQKTFYVPPSRVDKGRGKYCSKVCKYAGHKGRRMSVSSEFKLGLRPWNLGISFDAVKGEKSKLWKGDDVGYSGLHKWVKRNYEWPDECEICSDSDGILDLANLTGLYARDASNWGILCRSCHIKEDNANPKRPPYELKRGW